MLLVGDRGVHQTGGNLALPGATCHYPVGILPMNDGRLGTQPNWLAPGGPGFVLRLPGGECYDLTIERP